ncbi:MAG: hypothetical protein ABR540_13500 [Acidimicrobiales bacterium]|nr:hypothetical protein [Chloroflexota bacterium]
MTSASDAALALALKLLNIDGRLRPDEVGSPWPELSRFPGAFSDDDHTNHLHLGWRGIRRVRIRGQHPPIAVVQAAGRLEGRLAPLKL